MHQTDGLLNNPEKLEEADALCHGNRVEIQRKNEYIHLLQSLLDENHIAYLEELRALIGMGLSFC